jgi:geranylgeranyl diphosphate synthase type II
MLNHPPVMPFPTLGDELELLNKSLLESLFSYPHQTPELLEAAIYSVESPGHRWRPILFLKTYEVLGGENQHAVLPIACAIEFLHTASIILDDTPAMDNGLLRRGRRACHLKFGEARAVATAIWLCDIAQYLVHQYQLAKPNAGGDLEELLRLTKNEAMRGQIQDLERNDLSCEQIVEKYRLKSGAPYALAAATPAVVLDMGDAARNLKNFGYSLGIAYQISDDIHDQSDSAEVVGKDVHKDDNKSTIPALLGLRKSVEIRDDYKQRAIQELSNIPAPIDDLIELVEQICL